MILASRTRAIHHFAGGLRAATAQWCAWAILLSFCAGVVSADGAAAPQRIIVFAAGGPLIVDFEILVDSRPLSASRDALVDALLKAAAPNPSARATWQAVFRHPRFVALDLGQAGGLTPVRQRELARQYDANRDGYADPLELARYIEDLPNSGAAFRLQASSAYRDENRFRSTLVSLLDVDGDRRLSADEVSAGAGSLKRYDVDDDDLLYASELDPARAADAMMTSSFATESGPPSAMIIDEATNWPSVHRSLDERYQSGGRLGTESFRLVPRLAARLDGNGDGEIDSDEVRDLAAVPAHLVVVARFGDTGGYASDEEPTSDAPEDADPAGDESAEDESDAENSDEVKSDEDDSATTSDEDSVVSEPPLAVRICAPELRVADHRWQATDSTAVLEWFTDKIALQVRDVAGAGMQQNPEVVRQQFAALDGDSNGYLDEEEQQAAGRAAAAIFAASDADEDGQVYVEEILTYYEGQLTPQQTQVSVGVSHQPDAMFAAIDSSGDARLSLRELHRAARRLARLDRDASGDVSAAELPDALVIDVVRGGGDGMMVGTPVAAPAADGAREGPDWFDRMDLNGDADVTRREFLGSAEHFARLDRNGDGFIERAEARRGPVDDEHP